ncbi:aldehyde dehydrogenase (NAD+) [Salegentibacter holothuriorum]|uniref:aldehyde dehydrogenase (NAD(+)) n=1 Tax=Salegentibacter holothuriorum TaxID=241145 RepID=A0A1T5E8U7_9FLAO|nr:aldehyde dehydrogenase family protein [Salegentibacter holothuriorum]SKB80417.1 aldehyde dehydrogenase (NAD+) [Salegentibacter holothuriorum]
MEKSPLDILNNLNIKHPFYSYSTGQEKKYCKETNRRIITSPVDGSEIGEIGFIANEDYENVLTTAEKAFQQWRTIPAPRRGEIVRLLGDELRKEKEPLGALISFEMGKSLQEGYGEVQEMIDICEFATGLSRQLYGLQIQSERPAHRLFEQWHPLGIVGVISAFNFPVAVWAWNIAIALVCGNVCIWKPSEKTPFASIACQEIFAKILKRNNLPEGISSLVLGDAEIGKKMADDKRIPLISATGSTSMGRDVAQRVGKRLGKSILELGGNNAIILYEHSDIENSLPSLVFGAIGTAGQRCTSTRRVIVQEKIYDDFLNKLKDAFSQIRIGNPLDEENHMGPLIDKEAVENYFSTIELAKKQGAKIVSGAKTVLVENNCSQCYITPTIIVAKSDLEVMKTETFAPIVYVTKYKSLSEAIKINNNVPQGLSSALFSLSLREVENFLSSEGSDCGIANINIGTSGAEIGGAFGGEKDTGGGRESGSDAWKSYMRRQTCTVNYGTELPLAQGIKFNL